MDYTISRAITKLRSSSIHQLTCDMTGEWQNRAPGTQTDFTLCFVAVTTVLGGRGPIKSTGTPEKMEVFQSSAVAECYCSLQIFKDT